MEEEVNSSIYIHVHCAIYAMAFGRRADKSKIWREGVWPRDARSHIVWRREVLAAMHVPGKGEAKSPNINAYGDFAFCCWIWLRIGAGRYQRKSGASSFNSRNARVVWRPLLAASISLSLLAYRQLIKRIHIMKPI